MKHTIPTKHDEPPLCKKCGYNLLTPNAMTEECPGISPVQLEYVAEMLTCTVHLRRVEHIWLDVLKGNDSILFYKLLFDLSAECLVDWITFDMRG